MGHNIGNDFVALGEYLLSHPVAADAVGGHVINVYVTNLKAMAKHVGSCEKKVDDTYFELSKKFGVITVNFFAYRSDVCERVQVGAREIPEQILPAKPEEVIPAHTEPIYEWKCPESILEEA